MMSPTERVFALRKMLLETGGSTVEAAKRLDCSRNLLWYFLNRHDMLQEPQRVREWAKARFGTKPATRHYEEGDAREH